MRTGVPGPRMEMYGTFLWVVISLHGLFLGLAAGLLRWRARERALLLQHRLRVIADCNHHVRNALQAMLATELPRSGESGIELREHVQRIEWVLSEILPQVNHAPEEVTPQATPPFVYRMPRRR